MLIKSHWGILHFCTHAIPSSGACEKFRPGSSRIPTSSYQNRRAPCSFHNMLEWVSSGSCSELERLCSLSLNSFVHNKLCCALALVSVIFLDCLSPVQGCCSHLDYSSVIEPLYVYGDCYLMLGGCRKGFYQLETCCSTSPLHFPSSAWTSKMITWLRWAQSRALKPSQQRCTTATITAAHYPYWKKNLTAVQISWMVWRAPFRAFCHQKTPASWVWTL